MEKETESGIETVLRKEGDKVNGQPKAWLHNDKAIVNVVEINYVDEYITYYDASDCKNSAEVFDLVRDNEPNADCPFEMCDILWPAGLKDKDGREGYHKDIWEYLSVIYVVEWDEKKATFYLKNIHPKATEDDHIPIEYFPDGRIIGNIHENSELLEAVTS